MRDPTFLMRLLFNCVRKGLSTLKRTYRVVLRLQHSNKAGNILTYAVSHNLR